MGPALGSSECSCLSPFPPPIPDASPFPGLGNLMKRRELSAVQSAVSLGRHRVFGNASWFQEAVCWPSLGAGRGGVGSGVGA